MNNNYHLINLRNTFLRTLLLLLSGFSLHGMAISPQDSLIFITKKHSPCL